MLGEKELVKLFPDFADLVQPSGIDLELDKIYVQKSAGSLIDNEKNLPERIYNALPSPLNTFKVLCFSSDCSGRSWLLRNIDVYDIQSWGI